MAEFTKERLLCGLGKNDCQGVRNTKPYTLWTSMFKRCYSKKFHDECPSYAGCSVADEWHLFSQFLKFYHDHYVDGYVLDKDILIPGNKIYSPERCVFIPEGLNSFVIFQDMRRGSLPIGVSASKQTRKFQAKISINGQRKFLGYFDTPSEANEAWAREKLAAAEEWKELCGRIHPDLYAGLISKINSVRVSHA